MNLDIEKGCLLVPQILSEVIKYRKGRSDFVNEILNLFIKMGFTNARYYDIVHNVPKNDDLLILSFFQGNNINIYKKGYTIHYKNTTIAQADNSELPAIDFYSSAENNGSQRKWIDDLNLVNKNWIDIPLLSGNKLIALIACDWNGNVDDINQSDIILLKMMGSLIANRLDLIPSELFYEFQGILQKIKDNVDTVEQLLNDFLDNVCSIFNIALASAFKYSWMTDSLVKVNEKVNTYLQGKIFDFNEEYKSGEYLTGMAWNDDKLQYIVDFKSLIENKPHLVYKPSSDRHKSILGEITSVFYLVIGKKEKSYLLRFMNRSDEIYLPILPFQVSMIQKIAFELSDILDDMSQEVRLENLHKLSNLFIEKINEPDHVMNEIFTALSKEGFQEMAILSHFKDSHYFANQFFYGNIFSEYDKEMKREWKDFSFYIEAIKANTPKIYEIALLSEKANKTNIIGYLNNKDIKNILVFPFISLNTIGILVCTLSTNKSSYTPSIKKLINTLNQKYKIISTYAGYIGYVLEFSQSHLSAESARLLMSHIGHEVTTPASSLANTALSTLHRIKEITKTDDIDLLNFLNSQKNEIKSEMQKMGKTMELAMMVARQNQRLQLSFRETNFYNILKDCKESVERDFPVHDPYGNQRYFSIDLNSSCKKFDKIICDADLINHVFINLFKNAAKYSIPRERNRMMKIDVVGQPQTGMIILQIINWGLGIPSDSFEKIFRPYVRGDIHDERKAIWGMGLGLYIARRIMTAHQGSVYCRKSQATWNDPNRIKKFEGFETIFEVRIPTNLKIGIHEYTWEDWL